MTWMFLRYFQLFSIQFKHDHRDGAALKVMALRLRLHIRGSNMIDTIIDYRLQHAHNAVLTVDDDFLEK